MTSKVSSAWVCGLHILLSATRTLPSLSVRYWEPGVLQGLKRESWKRPRPCGASCLSRSQSLCNWKPGCQGEVQGVEIGGSGKASWNWPGVLAFLGWWSPLRVWWNPGFSPHPKQTHIFTKQHTLFSEPHSHLKHLFGSWIKVQGDKVKVVSDSLWPHGLYFHESPWNSPGQNTGVGSLSLLQGVFPT